MIQRLRIEHAKNMVYINSSEGVNETLDSPKSPSLPTCTHPFWREWRATRSVWRDAVFERR